MKVSETTENLFKTQWCLSIPFALLLCFNTHEQAMVSEGHKSLCGLRYHGSCICPKYSTLIEKRWVKQLKICSKRNSFSPFLSCCCSVLILMSGWWWRKDTNLSVGYNIMDLAYVPNIANQMKKRWVKQLKNHKHEMVSHHSFCITALFY